MNHAIGGAVAVALALAFAPLPAVVTTGGGGAPSAGGMGSPDAAVQELLDAARASDPLGVLAVLEPAERSLVKSLYDRGGAAAESVGGVDVDALLLALHIDIEASPLRVEQLADDVAWVTTDAVAVDLDIDLDAADDALAVDLSQTEFGGAGFEMTPAPDDLGVAVVREGDDWFISALYTAAEIGRRSAGQPASYVGTPAPVAPATTPDAAVGALLAAVSAQDLAAASGALTTFESNLVADFAGNIGASLLETVAPYRATITPQHVQVVQQSEGRAVVEVAAWSLQAQGGVGDDAINTTLTVNGSCADYTTLDDGDPESGHGCLFDNPTIFDPLSVLPEFGWGGVRFVAVNENGGWRVSLLETVLNALSTTITDAASAAGLVEVAGFFTPVGYGYDRYDGFYTTLATLVGSGAAVAPPGQSIITPSASGRIAVFAVDGPATVTVDVAGAGSYCTIFVVGGVVDEGASRSWPIGGCDDDADLDAGRGIVIVSEGGVFSSNRPIGTVTATVTPG